jgi:hypothetical protein
MLEEPMKQQTSLAKLLDTFFHLPTLVAIALICVVLLWQLYDIGVGVSSQFIRLNSNHGNIILYWGEGCCQIGW